MSRFPKFTILSSIVFSLFIAAGAIAQDLPGDNFAQQPNDQMVRQNFLRELGLNREQIQQIRMLNFKRAPMMREAQVKLRESNRNLDQAIYADTLDEKTIELRLQEMQAAQSEVLKIRAMSEIEIRKVLTPEQLIRFRELRERFAATVKANQQERQKRQMNRETPNAPDIRKNPQVRRPDQRQRP